MTQLNLFGEVEPEETQAAERADDLQAEDAHVTGRRGGAMNDELRADAQRFLAGDYRNQAAEALDSDESAGQLRRSSSASYGHGSRCFETRSDVIVWVLNGEERSGEWASRKGWPHSVTWAELKRHRDCQPRHLRQALAHARTVHAAEHRQHWEAMNAINERWYSTATLEQRAQLDTETERHWKADGTLRAAVHAAVLAMLPLATDEPTDLIEWAEALL